MSTIPGNPGWWAQGVAVAYEQHTGRRMPGQSCDGSYQVGASRTFNGSMDEARTAWGDLVSGLEDFGGVPLDQDATLSESEKWRYWRAPLADGSRVSLDIYEKAPGRSSMGINHTKLGSPEAVEHWRSTWKGLLGRL
ncbi:hypothetical protein ACQ3I4_04740 [Zafaria sp. Z1313]|uniref:hypothetical protein n=1 Tax=Zafaria sp. Z1313 TaxID=3423202 RepID=UPI003D302C0F